MTAGQSGFRRELGTFATIGLETAMALGWNIHVEVHLDLTPRPCGNPNSSICRRTEARPPSHPSPETLPESPLSSVSVPTPLADMS